jgi:multidrug efflux pump subunit AcrA (membrane-fusion protein)
MKKALIITGIIAAITVLIVFNKLISNRGEFSIFTEVRQGFFEITVTNSGELLAEQSTDIKGPVIGQSSNRGGPGQGGGRQQTTQMRGLDMRAMELKIQDIVPEGTNVKEGDYIAQLDRTSYDNTLKDELESLKTEQTNLEMQILDTAVTLTDMRDDIKNQRFVVEEANITLAQSKFEPPATIRQAQINLDKAQRSMEQKLRTYNLSLAKINRQIVQQRNHVAIHERRVKDLEEYLASFTIRAPSAGMVIYKKERNGVKRKAGSSLNPFDMVIATLPDLSSMISKTYVSEIEVNKVKTGQKVVINVDAFPEKKFNGHVISIANIGEQLPNSDAKMFEVMVKVDDSDPSLRPSMTTTNKIIIKSFNDVVYIPSECVHTGSDNIPFVYKKNKTKQIVKLGEANDKNVIIEKGLKPGTAIYLIPPEEPGKFKLEGENLLSVIKDEK